MTTTTLLLFAAALLLLVRWGLQSRRAAEAYGAALERTRTDLEEAKKWNAVRVGDINRAEAALVRAEDLNKLLTQRAAQLDEALAQVVTRDVSVSERAVDGDPFMRQLSVQWNYSDWEAVQAVSRTALFRALATCVAEQLLAVVEEKKWATTGTTSGPS